MNDNWRYKLIGDNQFLIDGISAEDPTDKIIDALDGINEEQKITLWDLLETLPEKHKYLIWLYFFEGKTLESIAKDQGCSKQNIHEQISKAIKILQLKVLFDSIDYKDLKS